MTVPDPVSQRGVTDAAVSEAELAIGTRLFVAMGQLARWSARQSLDLYGPGVLTALGTVVDVGPVRLGDLAVRLGVLPASVSRTVATLETAALVERAVDPEDRRSSFVSATPEGARLVTERRAERGEHLARRLGPLTAEQQDILSSVVDAIHDLAES
jgi:DNA-binding MarR family transcriptional regulator